MDEKQLQEIEARWRSSSQGVWWIGHHDCTDIDDAKRYLAEMLDYNKDNATIMMVGCGDFPESEDAQFLISAVTGNGPNSPNNGNFVANAHQDIPDLIAALRDAQEKLKQIELVTSVTESVRSQTVALLEKQRDEARSVVVEADAQFNIDKIPGSYDFAKVSIVRMAANGRAAMDECEELKCKLDEAQSENEKLSNLIIGCGFTIIECDGEIGLLRGSDIYVQENKS